MVSGAEGDEGPPLGAHSIRGFFSSAVCFANWSVSSMFLVGCGTLVLSLLWVPSLILRNLRACLGSSGVFAFL